MTQQEMWQATGMARATYLKLEHGDYDNPPVRYLTNCAIVLGCQLEELVQAEWRGWWKRLPHDPDAPADPSALWHA